MQSKQQMAISEAQFLNAAIEGDIITIRQAIQQGINIDYKGDDEWTALCWAITLQKFDIAKLLIENKADVNYQEKVEGESVLMLAATTEKENPELVQMLLDKGANVDLKDCVGWTALMHAVSADNVNIAKILLEGGANPDIKHEKDEELESPREIAKTRKMRDLFKQF